MQKEDKERVVAELTEKLRSAETLIVADYRGLTMPQIDALRGRLIEHGARLSVVKNTLTRRAAEAAGADALLALLEGPSAIAFIEADGDMVAVAKALADSARDTKVLEIRGGVMQGRDDLSRGRRGAREAPAARRAARPGARRDDRAALEPAALVNAPLQNLYGLIDARIEQLQAGRHPAPATRSKLPPRGSRCRGGTAEPRLPRRRGREQAAKKPLNRQKNPGGRDQMAAVDTVFEQLGSMTVLELVELKNKIEEEWGITAAAPVAVAAAGGGGGGGARPRRRPRSTSSSRAPASRRSR